MLRSKLLRCCRTDARSNRTERARSAAKELCLGSTNQTRMSDSVRKCATISVRWEPPNRLRRESIEGALKEG